MTQRQLSKRPVGIPVATSWLLADLGEAKGRQDLHTKREPERLRVLRQRALIESAISSNRIEGVVVAQARVEQVVLGRGLLTDRDFLCIHPFRDGNLRVSRLLLLLMAYHLGFAEFCGLA